MVSKIVSKFKSVEWLEYGLLIVSSMALALPFLFSGISWLSLASALPLLYYINFLQRRKVSAKSFVRRIWLVGFIFSLAVMWWFTQLNVITLLSDPWTRMLFIPITVGLFVGVFSLGFAFFGWVITKLKIILGSNWSFFLLPAAWAVGEYLRSVLFSIVSIGEGGVIGPHWNFGVLGFAASDTPLVFASRLVGLYGMSFLVILVNLSLYQLIFGKLKKQAAVAIALVLSLASMGVSLYANTASNKQDKVGIVHLSQYIETDYQKPLLDSIGKIKDPRASVVFMPEYSNFLELDRTMQQDKEIAAKITIEGSENIITTRAEKEAKFHANDTILLDANGEVKDKRGKTFLIPGGEFVPNIYKFILVASGNPQIVVSHQESETVKQSSVPIEPITINGVRYGVLACSGAIAPEFYRDITARNAEVLVNVASLSTMGLDGLYFIQAMQMSKFNAVANNRYYVQSARGKDSYILDNNGKVLSRNASSDSSYFVGDIKAIDNKTPYTIWGELVVYLSAAGLIIYSLAFRKRLKLYRFKRLKRVFRIV